MCEYFRMISTGFILYGAAEIHKALINAIKWFYNYL